MFICKWGIIKIFRHQKRFAGSLQKSGAHVIPRYSTEKYCLIVYELVIIINFIEYIYIHLEISRKPSVLSSKTFHRLLTEMAHFKKRFAGSLQKMSRVRISSSKKVMDDEWSLYSYWLFDNYA